MEYKIPIYSGFSVIHISSCNFRFLLPERVKNVEHIELLNGDIPYNTERYLFYDIEQVDTKTIILNNGLRVCGQLRWEIPDPAGKPMEQLGPQSQIVGTEECESMVKYEFVLAFEHVARGAVVRGTQTPRFGDSARGFNPGGRAAHSHDVRNKPQPSS